MSARPVALVILDGLGLAPAGPGNAVSLAHLPVFDELWATMPHTTLAASGQRRRAARRSDGQLGGRSPEPRRRPGRAADARAHRQRGRRRHARLEPRLSRRLRRRERGPWGAAPGGARLRRRRALARGSPAGARAGGDGAQGASRGRARLHGWSRRLAAPGGRPARPARARVGGHAGRVLDRRRPLLRDGSGRAHGAHRARARSDGRGARRARRPRRTWPCAPTTRAGSRTSSSIRSCSATRRCACTPAIPCSPSTSGPIACASSVMRSLERSGCSRP